MRDLAVDTGHDRPSGVRRFIRVTLLVAVLLLIAWIVLKLVIGIAFAFLGFVALAAVIVGVVWALSKL